MFKLLKRVKIINKKKYKTYIQLLKTVDINILNLKLTLGPKEILMVGCVEGCNERTEVNKLIAILNSLHVSRHRKN
jgi:hypothetical protein